MSADICICEALGNHLFCPGLNLLRGGIFIADVIPNKILNLGLGQTHSLIDELVLITLLLEFEGVGAVIGYIALIKRYIVQLILTERKDISCIQISLCSVIVLECNLLTEYICLFECSCIILLLLGQRMCRYCLVIGILDRLGNQFTLVVTALAIYL